MTLKRVVVRGIYNIMVVLSVPAVLLRLWWKGRKNPGYRLRWRERFGFFKAPDRVRGIWVHSVSLGESIAAIPMIREFQKRFPNEPLVVTTTTPSGSEMIRKTFADSVFHVYFPYDIPWVIRRFLTKVRPKILVILETELWPNCFRICKRRNIPIVIVNARLSPQSMKGYQRFLGITGQMLNCVRYVIAQSEQDGERYLKLGLPPARLVVAGNIKFDTPLKKELISAGRQLKEEWGTHRPTWVAASTHAFEEEQVLAAFQKILKTLKNALLILVPRHPERCSDVLALVKQQGYSVVTRSSGQRVTPEVQIFLGDTMGELPLFYAASDIAFVGGSLVPIGGHNTLEAAVLGIPVIVGPHVHNFVDITKLLLEAHALEQIKDSETLAGVVLHWFANPAERKAKGEQGKQVVEKNRGALKKVVDHIAKELG